MASPWVRFEDEFGIRWCQPDGFFLDLETAHIIVVEVKIKHTAHAWWQIRRLYEPVLQHIFGPVFTTAGLEVCAWYDRKEAFPELAALVQQPTAVSAGKLGIHICTPKVRDLPK